LSSLLAKFKKNVVGSKTKVSDYQCSLTASGEFKRISGLEVILNSWNNILLTPRGSYDHDPEYGSDLYKYIFEPADEETMEGITNEIKTVLETYDSRAKPTTINIQFLKDKKGFSIDIFVEYKEEEGQLSATIDDTSYFNFTS